MTRKTQLVLFCIFIIGALCVMIIQLTSPKDEQQPKKRETTSSAPITNRNTSPPPALSRAEQLRARTVSPEKNLEKRVTRYTDGSLDLTDSIKASSQLHKSDNPNEDLELVAQIFSQYRFLYKQNPVGTENFEFTAALTGDNPKKVNFIDPNSAALSAQNELLDRWGTPFVFHPLSGTEMEVLSYGPDKTPWTKDDLKLGEPGTSKDLQLNSPE